MNIQDFQLIQALYEYKNISRTAEALFLAQPTVSKRLRLIEEEFGIVIATRGKQGVEFTPEGEYLAVKAVQINSTVAQIRQHLSQMNEEPVRKLTVGASNANIHSDFLDFIADFQARYPKIRLELINDLSSVLGRMVEQEKLDFGLVTGEVAFSGEKLILRQERGFIGCAPPMKLEDLPNRSFLATSIDKSSREIFEKWWGETFSQPFPTGLKVTGQEAARDLILRGLGYSFFFRKDYFASHTEYIHEMKDRNGNPVTRNSWCMYHADRIKDRPEALAFLRALQSWVGQVR